MTDEIDGEDRPAHQRGLKEPWKPGQSGNPAGRPKGSRTKLAEKFWSDLYGKWLEKGDAAINQMIERDPGGFVKVVASQMPKELLIKSDTLDDLSDEDLLERLELIRSFIASTRGVGSDRKAAGLAGRKTTAEKAARAKPN